MNGLSSRVKDEENKGRLVSPRFARGLSPTGACSREATQGQNDTIKVFSFVCLDLSGQLNSFS